MRRFDTPVVGRHARRPYLLLALLLVTATVPRAATSDAVVPGTVITPSASAVVNFTDLARQQALAPLPAGPPIPLEWPEFEPPPEPSAPAPGTTSLRPLPSLPSQLMAPLVASPSPSQSYMGLDDIAMVDSNYIVIPPDVAGAVGPARVMESFNNNYRIRDKATGTTIGTVGTATFWAPVEPANLLNQLTDPRTVYDPYNNRWIAVMQSVNLNGDVLLGVSLTSDPAGSWYLYRFTGFTTSYYLDFPNLGFNKNWVAIAVNRYTSAGAFSRGICLAINYPLARTGTGSGTLFTMTSGTHYTSSPAVTCSATEETLFVVTHLGSSVATYQVDRLTGTSASPTYTVGGSNTRPGGGWVQPSGNILPQSAPNSGSSACTPPCLIDTQDAQVRTPPIYRNGFLFYTQTIGLPSTGLSHTAVQWTKITPSTTPAYVDGGRLEDPTATSTNGGKWYAYPALAVNAVNDFILGFSQFSSSQHPSAGYAFHYGTDGAGTLRDAYIYHAGEDYYHKTFSGTRNRWGDFSTAQVDPCDDMSLWTLQEYGKTRTGTDDGNTGSNSSRWSSWWAKVAGPTRVAGLGCPADTIELAGGTVTRKFRITNAGTVADQFSYSITDAAGWGGPASGSTPLLAPASFFDVFVSFTLPSDCNPASDLVTLSVLPVGATGCYSAQTCNSTIYCDLATATLVSRFDAMPAAAGVDLSWVSDAVGQIAGWNVYRAPAEGGVDVRINSDPIAMGSGGEFRLHDDAGGVSGDVIYRLGALLPGGGEQAVSSTRVALGGQAFSFALAGRNPSEGSTALRYALPRAERVRVEVYSPAGQRVRTLVDRTEAAGVHTVSFALREGSRALAPGVYLVRISAGADRKTLRVVMME
ncbi:MAG: T9SS type A sorting domain-containing protein [Candidatus Eisenbacteria bacterium]|nr:T9SS type A sorting domain-containing protein [Candidatus Eisenbacteria bacterium]